MFIVLGLAMLGYVVALDVSANGPATARGQADSPPPPTKDSIDKAKAREYEIYLERCEVCAKIRGFAGTDEKMNRLAEKLEAMAFDSYQKRIDKLNAIQVDAADAAPDARPTRNRPAMRAPNGRPIREDNQ